MDNNAANDGVIHGMAKRVAACGIRTSVTVPGLRGTWPLISAILLTLSSVLVMSCARGPAAGMAEEWEAPVRAARVVNPVVTGVAPIAAGKAIYQQNCLACHGTMGEGNGPAAIALERRPSDLSMPMMWEHSDGALFWKITEGRRPMPAFETLLTADQRWQTVDYLRTLAAHPKGSVPMEKSKEMPAMGDMH